MFHRANMLAGNPATFQYFDLGAVSLDWGGLLPSDWDGTTAPPSGAPNYFVSMDDDAWGYSPDALHIWEFHVDWTTPANSTLTGPTQLATAAFDSNLCNYSACIPQPGTARKLDALSDRLMYRLQYRNFGSYQAMITNHTVDVDGTNHAGTRWYDLRKSGGSWTIYQQGTYAPDSAHRWMGSIAMDKAGNMALGYSVSSDSLYPSIRYTGRLAGDPLGTLPQGEATLIAGGGSQTSLSNRWGDYSMMAVDPTDDCTFWYTNEYYSSTSTSNWKTRIGSFAYSSCTGGGGGGNSCQGAGVYRFGGTVRTSSLAAISGTTMTLTGPGGCTDTATTNSLGRYRFQNLAPGTYAVTPTPDSPAPGCTYSPVSASKTITNRNVNAQFIGSCP